MGTSTTVCFRRDSLFPLHRPHLLDGVKSFHAVYFAYSIFSALRGFEIEVIRRFSF